jgi:cytochrome c oxidase cbb3-type subunit 4
MNRFDGYEAYLVFLIASFIGIAWWAFGASRKRRFEKDGKIPFTEAD